MANLYINNPTKGTDMAKKSVKYDTANAGGWMNRADDLFLAQFRGRPCAICGATHSTVKGVVTRSMGHHLISKEHCRAHRFNRRNIIVLCPDHHTRFTGSISPHSENSVEVGLFYEWLMFNRPEQWEWVKAHYQDSSDGVLPYRDAYVRLGGELTEEKFKKDMRPKNHAQKVREAEERC